jgi:uncharacterized integral membrane protein (TIGR00698 family)
VQSHGLSALTLAILLGMLIGNSVYPQFAATAAAGVGFSKQTLLRLGVMLYGLRLTLQDVVAIGLRGVVLDAVIVGATFLIAVTVGTRWLGLDRRTSMLIGAGSAICGAAAVMAAEPVVRGRSEQVSVAVATVVIFGTLGMFLYPLLYVLNAHWHLIGGGARGFGIYAGSTIHEVAQVLAAARAIGGDAADTAVITKMVRVMMLAPFLIALSAWLARGVRAPGDGGSRAASVAGAIPWFAVGFIAVVLFSSLQLLPTAVLARANDLDTLFLATAMAALGLSTHASAFRAAGLRPLLLALVLFLWLVGGGALLNRWMMGAAP